MRPPQWVLTNSRFLNLDEFGARFSDAWSRIESRFLKLECWQTYQELEAGKSQEAYNRGEIQEARELLLREAEFDRPLYEDIKRSGTEYARIRLVQEPLTPYLEYELLAYEIREEMGENIEIVRCDAALKFPNEDYFDFLLFDRHTALVHDYGYAGRQSGGWITHDADVLISLEKKAVTLRRSAVPLRQFLTGSGR